MEDALARPGCHLPYVKVKVLILVVMEDALAKAKLVTLGREGDAS